jgi:membrane protein
MLNVAKQAVYSWLDDYAPSMSAALAYYTVFSIAPMLLIVVSIAGLVFGKEASEGHLVAQLEALTGPQAAQALEDLLRSVDQPARSTFAAVSGGLVLLVGATTVFAELQDSLDRIWRAPVRGTSGLWNLVRARLLSFGMILGIGFLMIVSLIASAILAALGDWWNPAFGDWTKLAGAFNTAFSLAFVSLSFALIYKIIPRVPIRWGDVWIGAVATAILFNSGKLLIGLYIGRSTFTSTFGAAASFAVLLVWVYYAAAIFLLGAEFTCIYAYSRGSLKGQVRPAYGTRRTDTATAAAGTSLAHGPPCDPTGPTTPAKTTCATAPPATEAPVREQAADRTVLSTASSSAPDRPD